MSSRRERQLEQLVVGLPADVLELPDDHAGNAFAFTELWYARDSRSTVAIQAVTLAFEAGRRDGSGQVS